MGYSRKPILPVTRSNWLHIPLDIALKHETRIREDLTFRNGAYYRARSSGRPVGNIPERFELWEEHDDELWVPRNYAPTWADLQVERDEVAAHMVSRFGSVWSELPHRIKLWDRQIPAVAALAAEHFDDRLLSLSCGAGKTLCALAALARDPSTRLPAVIVVNTQDLMQQWWDRIHEHLSPDLKIGWVQASKLDYEGYPITMAMIQSLASKEYSEDFYDYFRTVIFDEADLLGAPFFLKVVSRFIGVRWLLTATDKRSDGNDKLFKLHGGDVIYRDLRQDVIPTVHFVETWWQWDANRYRLWGAPQPRRRNALSKPNYKVNWAKVQTSLGRDAERNELILHWVARAGNQGRKILVLGERVENLIQLSRDCVLNSSPLVGSMKKVDREKALDHQVTFATSKLAKRALDDQRLDTLFILYPTIDEAWLQQAIGRIQRKHPDKYDPVVIIFKDEGPLSDRCMRIKQWCKKQGMRVYTEHREAA